jgi:HD-GYP domain-containing protein (c-di-GMP phosphodiesterase class II)
MLQSFRQMHSTIRFTVVTAFVVVTLLTASLAIGLQYCFGQAMAREVATDIYTATANRVTGELRSIGLINANIIDLLADNPVLQAPQAESAHLTIFTEVLLKNPLYHGIYLGRKDGSFYEVINLDASQIARTSLQAAPTDRWVVISDEIKKHGKERHYRYLNAELETRISRSEPTSFDVRSRPWYTNSMTSAGVHVTAPYMFAQLGIPGRTMSKRLQGSDTIVAIDMTMETVSTYLRQHHVAEQGEMYLFNRAGEVIASSEVEKRAAASPPLPAGSLKTIEKEYIATQPDFHAHIDTEKALSEHRSTAVPSQILTTIAGNPELQGTLVETALNDDIYLAYAASTGDSEHHLFLGVLSPRDAVVAPFLEQVRVSMIATALFLLLLIPVTWLFANPIVRPVKQLALENDKVRRREYAKVTRVTSHIRELDDLSDSMVSMVGAIQAHEAAQRTLMDAFIELIAQAIDDKSAYTGGHCKRVPELALMLAESASASDHPAFKAFHIDSDDEWREFRIAAWLHDCGKITTPEHIVDKGSKLETIYNRIHEIRMRFEVLWRDTEIDYLMQCAATPDQQTEHFDSLQKRQTRLIEDFSFVASCNVGGEFLDADKQERIKTIAQRTWQRHFDNRLGLSPLEELRNKTTRQDLPATEHLLADKPEHIIDREQSTDYPPDLGIDMDIPADLYNQGEVYNLTISRGTLTVEDRFKINEHMISTIKMLESLPFPEELKNVPRYASTHHETLKGTGYPRRLPGDKLSIPERLLAIADVFEALTAADRPYKNAKTVDVAIDILHKMVLDDHLDRDCFELFLREEIYLRYAKEFLHDTAPEALDLDKYLAV